MTSRVCEAAAQAGGQVVEASTVASWDGLHTDWDAGPKAAESLAAMLYRVVGCGCMCVVVGLLGSQDGHHYSGLRTDVRTGVDPGEGVAEDGRFHLPERASRHGSMQVLRVAAMGCHAIEVVEV